MNPTDGRQKQNGQDTGGQNAQIKYTGVAHQNCAVQKVSGQQHSTSQEEGQSCSEWVDGQVRCPSGSQYYPEDRTYKGQDDSKGQQTPLGDGAVNVVQVLTDRDWVPHLLRSQFLSV